MKLSYINNLSEKLYEELDDLAREDKKLLGLPRSIENRNRGIELIASVLRAALTRQVDETAQGEGNGKVYFRTAKEKKVIEYSPLSVKDLALLITKEKPNKIFNSEWSATKPFLEITEYINDKRFMMFCNGWADKTPQEFTPIRLYQHLKYQGFESCFILTSRTAEQKGEGEEINNLRSELKNMKVVEETLRDLARTFEDRSIYWLEENKKSQSRIAFLETELEIVRKIATDHFELITALEAENKRLREGIDQTNKTNHDGTHLS
jgi:hypothetical protein